MSRRSTLLFVVLCILWGVPYLFIRIAVTDVPPATLVFLRTGIGALILFPLALARGEVRPALRHLGPILAYTLAEMAVPWYALSSAEMRLSSSLSGLLIAAVPAIGTVISLALGFERPDRRRTAGILIGIVGVAALVGFNLRAGDTGAFLEMILVTAGYAVGPLIVARSLAEVPSLGVISVSLAVCALGYAPLGIAEMPRTLPPSEVLLAVGVLGLFCTATAFLVAFALIQSIGPVRMTVVTYVNPAVAVVLGVLALHESVSPGMVGGFVAILAGSYLTTRPLKSEERALGEAPSTL